MFFYKRLVRSYAGLHGTSSPHDKVFACPRIASVIFGQPLATRPRICGPVRIRIIRATDIMDWVGQPIHRRPCRTRRIRTRPGFLAGNWARSLSQLRPFW
jgi:hypothetical protein